MAPQPKTGIVDPKAPPGFDTAGVDSSQAALIWGQGGTPRSQLRVRTLIASRWMVIAGQALILMTARLVFNMDAPFLLCFALVGMAAWVNLLTGIASPGQRIMGDGEATAQLAFDLCQIIGLVYLTGGASNPFVLMMIAPVILAAATLPLRSLAVLGALAGQVSSPWCSWPGPRPGAPPPTSRPRA